MITGDRERVLQRAATLALVSLFTIVPGIARAEDDYRAAEVFSDTNRTAIESRCVDARHYAEIFATSMRDVDRATARAAQVAFIACANMKRLVANPDNVRFPILAAAASAFAEAMLSTGDDRDAALKRGYRWVNALLPFESDHTTLSSTGQFPRSKIVHITDTIHDPSQHAQQERFSDIALKLRAAIEGEYGNESRR